MSAPFPSWLKDAVLYQIYPQSFCDSNGDGIGDLKGIESKLDYIKSLGVDAIWLDPIFDSPFRDAGYDVRDFYTVAERYGDNGILKELIDAAHAKGLKVILDLVAGHTSIEHPWFEASASGEKTEYDDRFIWTNEVWNVPHRHMAGHGDRDGAYQCNFFYFQPALNYGFANPDGPWQQAIDTPGPQANRAELKNIMKHWLDMGCDGFRVDMAHSLIKGSGPARQKALTDLWQEIRSWMEANYPDAVLVAEWDHPEVSIQAGFHIDFMIHAKHPGWNSLFRTREAVGQGNDPYGPAYFEKSGLGNFHRFFDHYFEQFKATFGQGHISVPSGNHDCPPRLGKGRDADDMKVVFAFLLTMPGVPTFYYGDEIGMHGVDGLPSKEGAFNRTCLRTPMQWTRDPERAGFSTGNPADFYLPLGTDTATASVEAQEDDPESLLNFFRKLIRLRKDTPALGSSGDIELIHAPDGGVPVIYARKLNNQTVYVALNPADRTAEAPWKQLSQHIDQVIAGCTPEIIGGQLKMPPVSYSIWFPAGKLARSHSKFGDSDTPKQ